MTNWWFNQWQWRTNQLDKILTKLGKIGGHSNFIQLQYGITSNILQFAEAWYLDDTVLVGSIGRIKYDYALRELNMTKNEYGICYFRHRAQVKSLSITSQKNYFASGGHDIWYVWSNLWSIRYTIGCTSSNNGYLWFGIGYSNRIESFNLRAMKFEPFAVLKLNADNERV